MVSPSADDPTRDTKAVLKKAIDTTAVALAALDAADAAARDAAAHLDDSLAVSGNNADDREPNYELADAMAGAMAASAHGALDAIDDAAARTAAARTALAAARNALDAAGTAKPPYVKRILQRSLDAAGAGASGAPAREAINSAREAINSAREVYGGAVSVGTIG